MVTDWRTLTARVGRNDKPYLLFTHWHELPVEDKPMAVMESWSVAEWPEALVDRALWVMAFDEVGYMVDGECMDRQDDPGLPDPVTLWRGCTPDRRMGMAWSLDREKALWFARRWNGLSRGETRLYRITIPRDFVLARCTIRSEDEAIVDTTDFDDEEYEVEQAIRESPNS